MNWFSGNIPEAIAQAKATHSIFVVFIYDASDSSKSVDQTLLTQEISSTLSSTNFVCIKLENGSTDAKQFSQIYPLIIIPSIFFISGDTGVPLEVVGGSFTADSLIEKLSKLPLKVPVSNQESNEAASSCKEQIETNTSHPSPEEVTETNIEDESSKTESLPSSSIEADKSVPTNTDNGSTGTSQIIEDDDTLQARVELAQSLVNEIQAKKAQEEEEKVKDSELIRRRAGQEITKTKQKREDNERIDMARQQRKDRMDDKIAREEIKAKIEADKEERRRRAAELSSGGVLSEQKPKISSPQVPISHNGKTRIKLRFSSDTNSLEVFEVTNTLGDVRTLVSRSPLLLTSYFELVGLAPTRVFPPSEDDLTLEHLGLVPSACLLVRSRTGSKIVSSAPSTGLVTMLWSFLMAPLTAIQGYLGSLLAMVSGRRGRASSPAAAQSDEDEAPVRKQPRTQGSFTTRNRPASSYGIRSRREGNVHRLPGESPDDEENNTWNGNSTQQM